jgi:hypothetical protein
MQKKLKPKCKEEKIDHVTASERVSATICSCASDRKRHFVETPAPYLSEFDRVVVLFIV